MPEPLGRRRVTCDQLGFTLLVTALVACSEPSSVDSTSAPVVKPAVSWPASSSIDPSTVQRLDTDMRARIARAPVPVLLPRMELVGASLVTEPAYYAFSARRDGVTVFVQGTLPGHRHEGISPVQGDRRLRGTMGFVTENEGIRSASWRENNVAYAVEVECESSADARCAGDDYVVMIVEELAYVGGGGR